ncbi:MAG: hypothetical protein A2066_06370 [Bacteroidetes bacterium GWB2_41_8]|nr:MAG: hypothetical protein A2066_06370 [Bacteroidetes bacterium GWB2_41_8]
MKRILLSVAVILAAVFSQAQNQEQLTPSYQNLADKLLSSDNKLTIGGYGEVHFHQPFNSETRMNGSLDVHRMVMLFGYQFSDRTQFVTELEFEHVSEVYVEQAFLQHKINKSINFRGGLLLIPMGIVNEYHEPTTFNGVERPLVDNKISPTTWREIGFGLAGTIHPASLKYQAYLVNGFNGYDGTAKLNGKGGLRSGRQKGAESYISAPNFTAKVEYYGIRGLNVGLSGYFGDTQSKLYNGIAKDNEAALAKADSSVVGISMIGLDARYNIKGLQLRGQFYQMGLSNADQYNKFTGKKGGPLNDLGSSMTGYYIEAGYNVFRHLEKVNTELVPFVRLEGYDTHASVPSNISRNNSYKNSVITTGLTLKLAQGAVLKADLQYVKPDGAESYSKVFSTGLGVMF